MAACEHQYAGETISIMAQTADRHFDVIVVGGGAIGLSAGYHLGKRKAKTLVLDYYLFELFYDLFTKQTA